jgi:hypothetical protein
MRPTDNINEMIKKLKMKASADLNKRVHDDISKTLAEPEKTESAFTQPNIGRTIMKSRIVKLAAAAVIVTTVLIVISHFGGSGTSVVWAEVAQKVQASKGVIFRGRDTAMDSQDYTMNYLSTTQSRIDWYKGDQIIKTFLDDYDTKTSVSIFHDRKIYIKRTVEGMQHNNLWGNPIRMVQRFLSCEHREIEQKIVEGVLCVGIETTDPSFLGDDYPVDSFKARVWVSVETGYPVHLEGEIISNKDQIKFSFIADQFQWNVELDPNIFELNIPSDYKEVESPGIVEP